MRLRILSVVAVLAALTVSAVPSASANTFTNRYVGGGTYISYDDGGDSFCVRKTSGSSFDLASIHLYPATAGRGPSYDFSVYDGQTKCRSLATAYEDSAYKYLGTLGYDPPCRCGERFGGDFYS